MRPAHEVPGIGTNGERRVGAGTTRIRLYLSYYNIAGLRAVAGTDDSLFLKVIHEAGSSRVPDPETTLEQ